MIEEVEVSLVNLLTVYDFCYVLICSSHVRSVRFIIWIFRNILYHSRQKFLGIFLFNAFVDHQTAQSSASSIDVAIVITSYSF